MLEHATIRFTGFSVNAARIGPFSAQTMLASCSGALACNMGFRRCHIREHAPLLEYQMLGATSYWKPPLSEAPLHGLHKEPAVSD